MRIKVFDLLNKLVFMNCLEQGLFWWSSYCELLLALNGGSFFLVLIYKYIESMLIY